MIDRRLWMRVRAVVVAALLMVGFVLLTTAPPSATARSYQRISGEGSSWAANAIDAMRVNVRQFGITVDYNPSGSTAGRKNFLNGTVDFAASDIPFQLHPEDGSAPENPAPNSYAYIPVVAGGTSFMYNLQINGKRVTNLRLSGENISKIFTGIITMWNDPAVQADNPGLVMPARTIVPVVRSDGSGSTAQFTKWMISQYPDLWNDFCNRAGKAPACGYTSFYPNYQGMIAQSGDLGIAGYVSQGFAEGAIGYVNYSYALGSQFPVVKVLNKAGYYTEPTPQNVAVSLLKAQINTDASDPAVYLTQQLDGVYNDTDSRNYPLSSYSYFILPTTVAGQFNTDKGQTLGAFTYYAMCQAQQQSASLGYSPLPINLVQAGFDQIRKIPGVVVQDIDITTCKNPTFSPDGTNLLADTAPKPSACDKQSAYQCPDGTGGVSNVPTAILAAAQIPAAAPAPTTVPAAGGATPTTLPAAGGATPTTAPAAGGVAPTTTVVGGATPTTTPAGGTVPASGSGSNGLIPVLLVPAGQNCADSGTCQAASNTPAPAAAAPAPVGQIAPTVLPQSSGWNTSTVLMMLVVALTIALVLAPAAAWRHLANRGPA